ncbi:MAG: Glu-tRNA(Gln) amidotransferase subunit GatE [Thermoproteota archaeon]|nr:Glu-tRNA(Gln) amidotransferase subunit GatE [Thermoproteota archaeon]
MSERTKIGLEIHQQLATQHKLFCSCPLVKSDDFNYAFRRKLRPTHSEVGTLDPAAVFESKKNRAIKYLAPLGSTCLVEADEEPPYRVNAQALETSLIISLALHSSIEDEFHVMRKIVIDGSNTSGFQRTILIARGGYLKVDDRTIGVQSISLEEDAARIIGDDTNLRSYSLDRLGIPLVEIALEPIARSPKIVTSVALALGRLLRSTKRVARGIGSIRQDVNISLDNGPVVEVKGVQQLFQLDELLKYEILRQDGLIRIARQIRERVSEKPSQVVCGTRDVTGLLSSSRSRVIKNILGNKNSTIVALRVRKFKGLLGFEPYPGVRLGKQLSELVRFFGLGGIFHSDELPNYGISAQDVSTISSELEMDAEDAFIMMGGPCEVLPLAVREVSDRLVSAFFGVVPETRSATRDGSTVFIRPRPGSARMYPETDIPYISIEESKVRSLAQQVPRPWNEIISTLSERYTINTKLAEQIYDSDYFTLFEEIISLTDISPSFVVSKLTEDFVNFERQGYNLNALEDSIILEVFDRLSQSQIAKESLPLIFEKILKREVSSPEEAIASLGITQLSMENLKAIVDKVINDNEQIVRQKGNASLGLLMGRCMAVLRGKVDGEKINKLLRERLEYFLESSDTT